MKKDKIPKRLFLFLFLCTVILSGCAGFNSRGGKIVVKGSDTMYYLTIRLAAEYMKLNPDITLYVSGGGSATGFEALQKGDADICISSRNIRSEEVKTLAEKYSAIGMSYLVAKDAVSIYVNWRNPVEELSIADLKDIFTCRQTSWLPYGGGSDSIITVTRTPQSGTYEYFRTHVLEDDEYCENSAIINSTESMLSYIIKNKNAIGFGGIGFKEGVKLLKVNGVAPTERNVRNDTYPIIRYLYFYTVKSPKGQVKDFIDWVMSREGQHIIASFGYISIWE